MMLLGAVLCSGQTYPSSFSTNIIRPTADELRLDVEFLADTLVRGRGTGTRGAVETSFYVERSFRASGLRTSVQSFAYGNGNVGHNVMAELVCDRTSNDWVVVCACYDGLGEIQDHVYPGADSNASGLAVLLALSRRLRYSGKNILFVALDAHNARMAGAQALKDFLIPSGGVAEKRVKLLVNLDTMGTRLAPPDRAYPDYLIALGGLGYANSLRSANPSRSMQLYFDYYGSHSFTDMFYKKVSDQAPFLAAGVRCVMVPSVITAHTNKVSDTAETLDYELLATRAELVRRWLMIL